MSYVRPVTVVVLGSGCLPCPKDIARDHVECRTLLVRNRVALCLCPLCVDGMRTQRVGESTTPVDFLKNER
jgi:hypothetical protein